MCLLSGDQLGETIFGQSMFLAQAELLWGAVFYSTQDFARPVASESCAGVAHRCGRLVVSTQNARSGKPKSACESHIRFVLDAAST